MCATSPSEYYCMIVFYLRIESGYVHYTQMLRDANTARPPFIETFSQIVEETLLTNLVFPCMALNKKSDYFEFLTSFTRSVAGLN